MSTNSNAIVPVILCGGSGTRLWPLSQGNTPKQFLPLMSEKSLLSETGRRALRISGTTPDRLVAVTLKDQAAAVKNHLAESGNSPHPHILQESSARNTAAAVAFAALHAYRAFGEETILWVLPSDHHIAGESALKAAVDEGLHLAEKNMMVTFGIKPSRAETGYGYIKTGEAINAPYSFKAAAFVEKPDLATAQAYVDSGEYLWNSGMFMFAAAAVIREFETHAPDILDGVRRAIKTDGTVDGAIYDSIQSMPFDKAIMEKSDAVAVMPCDPGWSDIGSWQSLWAVRQKDSNGMATRGDVVTLKSQNSLIMAKNRKIGTLGINNLVIIETDDSILVADLSMADDIKALVTEIQKKK